MDRESESRDVRAAAPVDGNCRGVTPWAPHRCVKMMFRGCGTAARGGHGVPPLQRLALLFYGGRSITSVDPPAFQTTPQFRDGKRMRRATCKPTRAHVPVPAIAVFLFNQDFETLFDRRRFGFSVSCHRIVCILRVSNVHVGRSPGLAGCWR